MERRMLFVAVSLDPYSGYGTMARTHCDAFFQKKIPFVVFLPRSAKRIDAPYARYIHYVLPDLPLSFDTLTAMAFMPRLFVDIPGMDRFHFWAVHSLVDFPYAVIAHRIAKKHGIPFFFSAVGTYSVAPFKKYFDRLIFMPAYNGARRIFAISRFTADAMLKASKKSRSVDVVYLPVCKPALFSGKEVLPAHLPATGPLILSVGPLKERKGMDVLIRAMPSVLRVVPHAHLVIVAAYGDETAHRAIALACGISDKVFFLKNISSECLNRLFVRANVFAMTPRIVHEEFEGYGLVYIEAGWHKKPVVASRSGGVPEAVIEGKTGLIVPENDPQATANAINAILTDKDFSDRLGAGGYDLAVLRSPMAYAETLFRLYRS